jgi:hypothetical protein
VRKTQLSQADDEMDDPSPYVYGTGGAGTVVGFLMRYSNEIARELPHLGHLAEHFPGPSLGFGAGLLVGAVLSLSVGTAFILGGVGLAIGAYFQERGD